MTTFLFWNVQQKQLDTDILELVKDHSVDVLFLLEYPKPDIALFQMLNKIRPYHRVQTHERFSVYVNFNSTQMVRVTPPPTLAGDRVDFWDVRISKKNRLFMALVHGYDIINVSEVKRSMFFERLRTAIEWMEENDPEVKHNQTVVLGDFNANPFDDMVGGVRGLHAIRLKDVGGKINRSVLGVDYAFFCNPMWSCFRGWERAPPGTHYFNGNDAHEVFWHMIDQVVLRPQALHMFSERNLKILTEAGNASLLSRHGLPNASDHLPIIFKLNLNAKVIHGEPVAQIR